MKPISHDQVSLKKMANLLRTLFLRGTSSGSEGNILVVEAPERVGSIQGDYIRCGQQVTQQLHSTRLLGVLYGASPGCVSRCRGLGLMQGLSQQL